MPQIGAVSRLWTARVFRANRRVRARSVACGSPTAPDMAFSLENAAGSSRMLEIPFAASLTEALALETSGVLTDSIPVENLNLNSQKLGKDARANA